jgi:hypothetical protein
VWSLRDAPQRALSGATDKLIVATHVLVFLVSSITLIARENSMNRRQALQTALTATVSASLFRDSSRAADDSKGGESIHVHAANGSDDNPGTQTRPLRTLAAAARRVNQGAGSAACTVLLAEGVYPVGEPAIFKPASRTFTRDRRLTVRAEVLPDDPAWSPQRMPVLIHTMPLSPNWMGRPDPFGGVGYGMQFETSHVTVRGLKILGTPHLESPTTGAIRRVYPIAREGADFDDLEIKQCLFVGNREVAENHCCILARGHGVVVDHCVFHGCKITVVYWSANARGCAFRYTLAIGSYVTAAWLCGTGEDFDFANNVMSSNRSALLFQGGARKYRLASSLFAGNDHLYGSGFGPAVNFKPLGASTLELPPTSKVVVQPVVLEMEQSRRDYLHVAAGKPGAERKAGLFLN